MRLFCLTSPILIFHPKFIILSTAYLIFSSINIETIEVESINKVYTPRGVNVTIKDVPELELFLPRDILDETPKKFFFIRKVKMNET